MAKSDIIKILYNPSSLCSVKSGDGWTNPSYLANSYPESEESLQMISTILREPGAREKIMVNLARLNKLMRKEIPLSFRPELFKEVNELTKTLAGRYPQDKQVFQACFEALTTLKEQIDRYPQNMGALSEMEWVELEKVVYLLCDWEDGLEVAQSTQPSVRKDS